MRMMQENSCSLAGLDTSGRVVLRCRMRRSSVASFVKGLGRCIAALEACCGAHHLGRLFAAQGHEVRLMLKIRGPNGVLDERIAAFDAEFVRIARNDEAVRRLTTIPGIGTINATALAAAVGNARAFRRGRDMATWIGLTPRQR